MSQDMALVRPRSRFGSPRLWGNLNRFTVVGPTVVRAPGLQPLEGMRHFGSARSVMAATSCRGTHWGVSGRSCWFDRVQDLGRRAPGSY
jgi:hypothetical protein